MAYREAASLTAQPGTCGVRPMEKPMFVLREGHLRALNAPFVRKFVRETAARLRSTCPAQTEGRSDEQVQAMVRALMPRAQRYDIHSQRDVRAFIVLEVTHGPRFEHQPNREWVMELLTDPDLAGQEKIDLIEQQMTWE